MQRGVSLTVRSRTGGSAACSAESAAILLRFRRIHSSIDDPDRFMIKCKRSHARGNAPSRGTPAAAGPRSLRGGDPRGGREAGPTR